MVHRQETKLNLTTDISIFSQLENKTMKSFQLNIILTDISNGEQNQGNLELAKKISASNNTIDI